MIAFDSNLLIYALNASAPEQAKARSFFDQLEDLEDEIVVCELVLVETYSAIRSPAIFHHPCTAQQATALLQPFRQHPRWRLVDYPGVPEVSNAWWQKASDPAFARRHVFDTRLALTLRHHGVTRFATRNVKDFQTFGFEEVWDPLSR